MIEFLYSADPGYTTTVPDEALNIAAMPYYSIGDSDISLGEEKVAIADQSVKPNDGVPLLLSNSEAKAKGLTTEDSDTKWLSSEVTVYKGNIIPGIEKEVTSSTNSTTGVVTNNPSNVSTTDLVTWRVTARNDGTDALTDYTITDVIPKPYTLSDGSRISIFINKPNNDSYRTKSFAGLTVDSITYDTEGKISSLDIFYYLASGNYRTVTLYTGTPQTIYARVSYSNQYTTTSYNETLTILFDYDEDGNLYMSFRLPNGSASIPASGTLRLSYTTEYRDNALTNKNYFNNAYLTPMMQSWSGETSVGEYMESGVTEETKDMPTVHNLAFVTMTNGYGTTSDKTVSETGNQQNSAGSNSVTNYIVLDDSQKTFEYTLNVNNISDHAMNQFILIDNLPQIGDHETFDSSISRGSEFTVKLSDNTDFVVTVAPNESSAGWQEFTLASDQYSIQYSTKTEFDDTDWSGNGNGWTTYQDGADLSNARSIRLIIQDAAGELIPSRSNISLTFTAEIDDDNIAPGMYAWNSFGYSYSMTDSDTMLMATPLKVGVAFKGMPLIEKQIVDASGADYSLDEAHAFNFILYAGDRIFSVEDNAGLDEMMTAINENDREFTYITLNVNAGESSSGQVQLSSLHAYTYDSENGFTETSEPWNWVDGSQYTIWEIPKDGYIFDSVNDEQIINNSNTFLYNNAMNQVFTCVNEVIPDTFDIRVNKYYDETVGETNYTGPVEGAVLQVWNADKSEMLDEQTVDETGYVTFTELEAGNYVLVEAEAPEHFVIAEDIAFTVNKDGMITTENSENIETDEKGTFLKMKDEMEDGSIIIQKYEDDGETPLAGVTYNLYDSNDQLVDTKTTGEDGKVTFTEVPFGDYTIVETKTAEGYNLLAEPISVTLPLVMTADDAQANDADTTNAF